MPILSEDIFIHFPLERIDWFLNTFSELRGEETGFEFFCSSDDNGSAALTARRVIKIKKKVDIDRIIISLSY